VAGHRLPRALGRNRHADARRARHGARGVKAILLADPVMSRDISLLQLKQRMLSPAALRMKETLIESVGRLQANYADATLA